MGKLASVRKFCSNLKSIYHLKDLSLDNSLPKNCNRIGIRMEDGFFLRILVILYSRSKNIDDRS